MKDLDRLSKLLPLITAISFAEHIFTVISIGNITRIRNFPVGLFFFSNF